MSRQRESDIGLLPGSGCLGHTCGTNINTEGVEFTNKQPNLVYIDKVFSYNQNTASPILFDLNTGGANAGNFTVQLTLGNCLLPCTLTPNAVFTIDNSYVVVDFFNTRPPGNITAPQVTLDGFPVDSVTYTNGQYTAVTTNVLSRIQNDRCLNLGLPTKAFFMINNAGPWDLRATYVLEGTVNTGGRTCRFRAVITNAPNTPNTMLPGGSLSSFAIRNLALPCIVNGVAPNILFQFNARVNLVNPRLVVTCGAMGIPTNCTVSLLSTVAVDPTVHVESVRRTLFCINACEGRQPCQGSILAGAMEENLEDCAVGGVHRPDCRCSMGNNTSETSEMEETTEEFHRSDTSEVGGAATGPCEDCVFGDTPQNCRPCRNRRDHVSDTSGGNEVGGIRRRSKGMQMGMQNGDGLPEGTNRTMLRNLVSQICDELAGVSSQACDVLAEDTSQGHGMRKRTPGAGNEETEGVSEQVMGTARTASRLHGSNGCSW